MSKPCNIARDDGVETGGSRDGDLYVIFKIWADDL